jgi:hypothetical protein
VNPATPNPSCYDDQSTTTTEKKPYEAPHLIELGNVSDLTNYNVSVHVSYSRSGQPSANPDMGSGDSHEA